MRRDVITLAVGWARDLTASYAEELELELLLSAAMSFDLWLKLSRRTAMSRITR